MEFDLPVLEEKIKPHQLTALHLINAFAFTGAGAIIAIYNYSIPVYGLGLLFAGLTILALTIFKNKWLITGRVNLAFRILEAILCIWIFLYAFSQRWKFPEGIFAALGAAVLFAIYWEQSAGSGLFVHIDQAGVRLPVTSRKRFLPWTEIEQVTLKYGILSVDCTDNHLFQWSLGDISLDTGRFESFCVAKVDENKSKRLVDDW